MNSEQGSDASTPSSVSSGPALEIDEGSDGSLPSTPGNTDPQPKEPEPPERIPILPTQGTALTQAPQVTSTPPSQTSRPDMYDQPPVARAWDYIPEAERWTMEYLCHDCEAIVKIKQGEPTRCKDCGCCMLWKKHTATMRQFQAI